MGKCLVLHGAFKSSEITDLGRRDCLFSHFASVMVQLSLLIDKNKIKLSDLNKVIKRIDRFTQKENNHFDKADGDMLTNRLKCMYENVREKIHQQKPEMSERFVADFAEFVDKLSLRTPPIHI